MNYSTVYMMPRLTRRHTCSIRGRNALYGILGVNTSLDVVDKEGLNTLSALMFASVKT